METENKDSTEKLESWILAKEPTQEDVINRKIVHVQFAKTLLWLCYKTRKEDFVYVNELKQYLKVSRTRSYEILNDLVSINILNKKVIGNVIEYHFVKNSHNPIVNKYMEKAKKTLGIE